MDRQEVEHSAAEPVEDVVEFPDEVPERAGRGDDRIAFSIQFVDQGTVLGKVVPGTGPCGTELADESVVNAARDEASAKLMAEVMGQLQRQKEAQWKQDVRDKEATVADELAQRPEYRARDFLTGDRKEDGIEQQKLDAEYIKETYPDKSKKLSKMTKKGGEHPDVIAPMFGFRSGDELF